MELPHLGQHCSESSCRQLDFLPFTCKLCEKVFCLDHHKYDTHNCPESYRADAQVPICPLCSKPVPSKRGQAPDLAVNEHMENNCQNKKNKAFLNRCSLKSCKNKEVIQLKCDACSLNYCVKHRHADDHNCGGPAVRRELVAAAAKNRITVNHNGYVKPRSSTTMPQNGLTNSIKNYFTSTSKSVNSPSSRQATTIQVQGHYNEDEALARALAESSAETNGPQPSSQPTMSNEDEDAMLARAIAASLADERKSTSQNKTDGCHVS